MTIDRNSPAFAHHNVAARVTASEGPNKNRSVKIQSHESVKMDPGGKPKAIIGAGSGPITTVSGGAEPTFEFKLSTNLESIQLVKLLGNIHTHFMLTVTMQRPGLKRATYRAYGCLPKSGLGFDSSQDNAVQDTVSGICSDITFQEEGGKEISLVHQDSESGASLGGGSGGLGINIGVSIGF